MTTGDKLNHFMEIVVKDADQRGRKALEDYERGLDAIFESFCQESLRKQEAEIKAGREKRQKEVNTELAECQIKIRKRLGEKQEEMKTRLFGGVEQRLAEFKKTPDYYDYLTGHIKKALRFARKEAIEIYLDPEDIALHKQLEQDTGAAILISKYSFGGGIRAVIRSKRVLIDQSFDTRLYEAKKDYLFYLD